MNKDDSYFPLSVPKKGAGGHTGDWRLHRPVVDHDKCTGCEMCWILCPDGVIGKEDRSIDLDYCKGCGICAVECPVKAIEMVREEGA